METNEDAANPFEPAAVRIKQSYQSENVRSENYSVRAVEFPLPNGAKLRPLEPQPPYGWFEWPAIWTLQNNLGDKEYRMALSLYLALIQIGSNPQFTADGKAAGSSFQCSYGLLENKAKMDRRTMREHLERLQSLGLIAIDWSERKRGERMQEPHSYAILSFVSARKRSERRAQRCASGSHEPDSQRCAAESAADVHANNKKNHKGSSSYKQKLYDADALACQPDGGGGAAVASEHKRTEGLDCESDLPGGLQ